MTPLDLQTLGQQYIAFAQNEIPKGRSKTRSPTTISSFRRAVEGFVAAAEGRDLTTLPDDFIEVDWLRTQKSVLHQAIQLRVRVSAVNKFIHWLQQNGIPVPKTLRLPEITTPEAKKKEPSIMSDVTHLADPSLNENPVPSVHTQPVTSLPVSVPPPAPVQPRPQPQQRRENTNPLASMFPSAGSGWKLRVRRERESGEDPVFIGDYPLDRVQLFGAVEPFLVREVAPKVAAQGIIGDVTFIVSAVDSRGGEEQKRRMTIAVASVQSVQAPVAGAVPVALPINPASSREELSEVLAIDRRAREEERAAIENRIAERIPTAAPSAHSAEMAALQNTVEKLSGVVAALAERVMAPQPAPVVQVPPQSQQPDVLSLVKAVMEMSRPAAAPPQQLTDVFAVLGQAKAMFAPANVNIDVSPLEEQMHELRKQLAETKKGGLAGVLEDVKVAKELFQLVDPAQSAPKPTSISSALGGLIEKIASNPAPVAEAVERILNGLGALKSGTPAQQPSNQSTTPSASRSAGLPRPLADASVALLKATTPDAQAVAAYEWLKLLVQVPETAKVAERMSELLKQGKSDGFAIVLKQTLTHLGFGQYATAQRTADIAKAVAAKLAANNKPTDDESAEALLAADDGDEGDEGEGEEGEEEGEEGAEEDEGVEEEEQGNQNPDLTVRVGGAVMEDDDEEVEEDEDDEDEGEDEPTDDPEPTPEPEPVPEPKSRRSKKRGSKEAPVIELSDLDPKPEVVG